MTSLTEVGLSWADRSTNETAFKIEAKAGAAGAYQQIALVSAGTTAYTLGSAVGGVQYFFRVRACNAMGDSAFSNEASVTASGGAPTAPA